MSVGITTIMGAAVGLEFFDANHMNTIMEGTKWGFMLSLLFVHIIVGFH